MKIYHEKGEEGFGDHTMEDWRKALRGDHRHGTPDDRELRTPSKATKTMLNEARLYHSGKPCRWNFSYHQVVYEWLLEENAAIPDELHSYFVARRLGI